MVRAYRRDSNQHIYDLIFSFFTFIRSFNLTDATAKSSKRKPARDPNRPKRQHTAYTMYVTANYESIKVNNPGVPPKDMISMVARQWAQVSEEEKEHWKQRAVASAATGQVAEIEEELAGDDVEHYVEDDENQGEDAKKKRATSAVKKVKVTVTV